jgi:3-oxoadipate enol-lactonase
MGQDWDDLSIDTGLGRLHVRGRGAGPAILFWPSLLMDGAMWFGVADALPGAYRVILVDPPGHGRSEALTGPFDFATCARCIVEILDALAIERAHYVGNSWGAMIGGAFAATYPDRVGAAVLMNGTASVAGPGQRLQTYAMLSLSRLLGGIRGPLRRKVAASFLGPTSFRSRPDAVSAVYKAIDAVNIASSRWAVECVVPRRPDQHALLARITTPVMVVAGREDSTFPVAETRAMANSIPGARFVLMPDAAHLAGLECPREVAAMVDAFIRETT